MTEPIRVQGYHGTTIEKRNSILSEGYIVSRNEYDWLGDGVYFFQDAPKRAWEWAEYTVRKLQKGGKRAEPAVLGSVIRLEDCIDLFDIGWMDELHDLAHAFEERFKAEGKEMPNQRGKLHYRDGIFLNFVVWRLERDMAIKVKCIRAAFIEGDPMFEESDSSEKSAIFDRAHVQIAVLDTSIIEKTWKVEQL